VDAVVEGSVMRSGNRVRISTRLIDARSDRNLWAESYESEVQDVLALQQEAAGRVAAEVGVDFSAADRVALENKRVVNPQAHEAYLRGLFYWNQFSCDSFEKSLAYFRQSQAKDPNFPPVYVGIAQAYSTLYNFDCLPQEETLPKARDAALKALELDPTSGAAHMYLGKYALNYEFDWEKAEAEFRQGIALDPNNGPSRTVYASFLLAMGRRQEAFTEMKEALELDPTSLATNVSAAYFYYLARDYDHAIKVGKKTIELYPKASAAYLWLAFAYEAEGKESQALAAHLKADSIWGTSPQDLTKLRRGYEKSGRRGYWLAQLAAEKARGGDKAPSKICWMAEIYAQAGDNKQSLAYLNQALQHPCNELPYLGIDPLFDGLRGDPGFRQILAQLHL